MSEELKMNEPCLSCQYHPRNRRQEAKPLTKGVEKAIELLRRYNDILGGDDDYLDDDEYAERKEIQQCFLMLQAEQQSAALPPDQSARIAQLQSQRDRLLAQLKKDRDDIGICRTMLHNPEDAGTALKYRNYLVNQLPAIDALISEIEGEK